MTESELKQQLQADAERERNALARGECPQCGTPGVEVKLDGRQSGYTEIAGAWHNVRCGACRYRADFVLPTSVQ